MNAVVVIWRVPAGGVQERTMFGASWRPAGVFRVCQTQTFKG